MEPVIALLYETQYTIQQKMNQEKCNEVGMWNKYDMIQGNIISKYIIHQTRSEQEERGGGEGEGGEGRMKNR